MEFCKGHKGIKWDFTLDKGILQWNNRGSRGCHRGHQGQYKLRVFSAFCTLKIYVTQTVLCLTMQVGKTSKGEEHGIVSSNFILSEEIGQPKQQFDKQAKAMPELSRRLEIEAGYKIRLWKLLASQTYKRAKRKRYMSINNENEEE